MLLLEPRSYGPLDKPSGLLRRHLALGANVCEHRLLARPLRARLVLLWGPRLRRADRLQAIRGTRFVPDHCLRLDLRLGEPLSPLLERDVGPCSGHASLAQPLRRSRCQILGGAAHGTLQRRPRQKARGGSRAGCASGALPLRPRLLLPLRQLAARTAAAGGGPRGGAPRAPRARPPPRGGQPRPGRRGPGAGAGRGPTRCGRGTAGGGRTSLVGGPGRDRRG
mmetsp:Transcript_85776/g.276855  ORF Transcript_85776/g.276855 Transcript_85776/m.276855 type:complete len:223 (+) Transcript_85776:1490-2158(+)